MPAGSNADARAAGPIPAPLDAIEQLYADAIERGRVDVDRAEGIVASWLGRLRTATPLAALDHRPTRGPARYLPEHVWNVTRLALWVALQEGWPDPDVAALGLAGLWHDVGMGAVPPYRWLQARWLEPEDLRAVQTHADAGRALLERVADWPPRVATIVGQVHERADGSGYPAGLAGDAIDPAARLLAVCDTYDALIAPRLYREPFPAALAVRALCAEGEAGRLDPDSVRAFVAAVGLYPVGTAITLSDGARGRAVAANPTAPDRPVVEIWIDGGGTRLREPRRVELATQPRLAITPPSA